MAVFMFRFQVNVFRDRASLSFVRLSVKSLFPGLVRENQEPQNSCPARKKFEDPKRKSNNAAGMGSAMVKPRPKALMDVKDGKSKSGKALTHGSDGIRLVSRQTGFCNVWFNPEVVSN